MNEYDKFERLLREELRPRAAPEGFAERLHLRQVVATRARWRVALHWTTAALLLLSFGGGAYWKHERDRKTAGERAREQVMLALRITAATLGDVQQKIAKHNKGAVE